MIWSGPPAKAQTNLFVPPKSKSITLNFDPAWKMARGSYPVNGTDDSSWQTISTPHTYHQDAGYTGVASIAKDLGPYTYRKHFQLPLESKDQEIILEFEGVRQRGTFYLNGHFLGDHDDGVTPFGFDITPLVHFGGEDNILQAQIDCSDIERKTGAKMSWVFPGFNPLYGGICRHVRLHILDKVHATLPLYSSLGTTGTYVYAEDISTEKRSAEIGVETEVKNDLSVTADTDFRAIVVDREGIVVATLEAPSADLKPGTNFTFKAKKFVQGLHFWQPGYPYLYDVYTIVSFKNKVLDVQKVTTGFRKIEVRGAALYVNNRVLMTMGYTPRSQNEWPAIGNAYPDWLHDYTNNLMVEGNARLVRWEHVMPSPQDVESCDRIGLPQIIPGADRENDSIGAEWQLRKSIMRDAIIYLRNSPSIFLWEAANNVLTAEHSQEMIDLRDKWDPRGYQRPMGGRAESPEWVSWMYGVRKEMYRLSEDTEFMRDETARRWWDSYSPPYFHKEGDWKLTDNAGGWNRNQDNMCVMQSIVYDQYFKARPGTGPSVCNGGVQIMFADSDSFSRSVDPFRRSGPVDGMRIPKDTYGCNQTMWSNTRELWTDNHPSLYLPGHWNYPAGTIKPMYVFVSPGIEHVDLLINGKKQPEVRRTNDFLFTFENIAWEPGTVEAVGYDSLGKIVASMQHETTGEPATVRATVTTGPQGLEADGCDLALVQAEIVDATGRRCPCAANLLHYEIEGPAIWRGGIWEENVAQYANKTDLPVVNGVERVFVRSTLKPGQIKIKISTVGLPTTEVDFAAKKIDLENGYTTRMPDVPKIELTTAPSYGPDLPPPPVPPPHAFDTTNSDNEDLIFALTTAFPSGAEVRHHVANGSQIYKDEAWTFANLPDYLQDADYLLVANADTSASAGEGVVFKIGRAGRVYVAYDDGNQHFPEISSPTGFVKTADKIVINGRAHTIYASGPMNGGELTYLGTNNWTDKPIKNVNNYVVFVKPKSD